jgi:hypothetical protein
MSLAAAIIMTTKGQVASVFGDYIIVALVTWSTFFGLLYYLIAKEAESVVNFFGGYLERFYNHPSFYK